MPLANLMTGSEFQSTLPLRGVTYNVVSTDTTDVAFQSTLPLRGVTERRRTGRRP